MKTALAAVLAVSGLVACKGDAPQEAPAPTDPAAEPVPTLPAKLDEWVTYTSELGGFSIRFPVEPSEKVQIVETSRGPADTHLAVVDMESRAFLASWQLQPREPTATPEELLDRARDAMLASMPGAMLVQETDVAAGPAPGRSELIKLAQPDGVQHSRIYLVGDKLITLAAIGTGERDAAVAGHFLDSFALAPPPAK